jgi:hypothetical protein
MVTTKGGTTVKRDQKPTISYDGYYGWSKVARLPEFMNGQQFYNFRFMKFLTYAGNGATATSNLSSHPVYQIGGTILEQCLLREAEGSGAFRMKEMLASGNTYDWPDMVRTSTIILVLVTTVKKVSTKAISRTISTSREVLMPKSIRL